jgi:hypothetical protein
MPLLDDFLNKLFDLQSEFPRYWWTLHPRRCVTFTVS